MWRLQVLSKTVSSPPIATMAFFSCSEDEDGTKKDTLTVGGSNAAVSHLFLETSEPAGNGIATPTLILSSNISLDTDAEELTGSGSLLAISIQVEGEGLAAGKYEIDLEGTHEDDPFYFTLSVLTIDTEMVDGSTDGGTIYFVSEGSLNVEKSDAGYTVDFKGKAVSFDGDYVSVKANFTGALETY